MVNTFLPYEDYDESAQSLDRQRLGKQRVEAFQILNIIKMLRLLSIIFNSPIPNFGNGRKQWIKKILSMYKSLVVNGQPSKIVIVKYRSLNKRNRSIVIYLPHDFDDYESLEQRLVSISNNEQFISAKQLKLGFSTHTVVEMWLGYEGSLKLYINAMINEWIKRGYKNNMKVYDINKHINKWGPICHPPWVNNSLIHENHRSALLFKEIHRSEPDWYINIDDFYWSKPFIGYLWYSDNGFNQAPLDKSLVKDEDAYSCYTDFIEERDKKSIVDPLLLQECEQ